ncbi:phage tail tip lysozyme [Neoroseomonas alba]
MNTASGATAATARRLHGASFGSPFGPGGMFDAARWRHLHPDGTRGDRLHSNAVRYVLQGTSFASGAHAPQAMVPMSAGGAQPSGGGGISLPGFQMPSAGGVASGLGRSAMSGGAWMLGMAGVGAAAGLAGMASQAVSQAQQEAVANDTLLRSLRDLDTDFGGLRRSVRDATAGLGLTYQEAQRLSLAWVRATNETSGDAATRNMRFAVGAARSLGLESGSMVGGAGRAAFLGEDPRRFAVLLAETMRDSRMTGQGEAVMGQLLRWQEGFARNMSGAGALDRAAGMYATLSSSGIPGLRGEMGASLMDRVNASLSQGGAAGDASMHLTYRAMARNGITDPYRIEHLLAGGMFERIGENGPTVFEATSQEINRLYAGMPDYQRWHAMGRHFGINPRQAQALERAMRSGGNLGGMGRDLAALGINIQDINPTSLAEIAELSGHSMVSAEAVTRFRQNRAIPQADRDRVGGMLGEDQRREMIRLLAQHGGTRTDGDQVRDTMAQMANALTAAGTGLVPVLNDMREVLSDLGQNIGTLSETLGDVYEGYVRGNPDARQSLERRRNGGAAGGNFRGEAITGAEEAQRARFIYEEGIRRGLTHEQASAVVAQARVESNFRAGARGDSGRSHGVFQHDAARRAAMERQFGLQPGAYSTSSFEGQVRMSYWEMLESSGRDNVGAALRRTQTAREAGALLSNQWERPGDRLGEARRRGGLSENFSEHFRNGGAMPDAPNAVTPARPDPPGNTPAPAPARPDGQQQAFNIAPLDVFIRDSSGAVMREESLPVTRIGGDARPWGIA